MNIADPELPIALPGPEVSPAEVEQLVGILREAGDWATAADIATKIGDGATERSVRKVASAAGPAVVSFPGSRGYKLWQLCTVAEIDRCIASFEAQGREMYARAIRYRQAYHRRFRGAPSKGALTDAGGPLKAASSQPAPESQTSVNLPV